MAHSPSWNLPSRRWERRELLSDLVYLGNPKTVWINIPLELRYMLELAWLAACLICCDIKFTYGLDTLGENIISHRERSTMLNCFLIGLMGCILVWHTLTTKRFNLMQNVGQNPEAHTEDKNSNHQPYADIHAWLKVYKVLENNFPPSTSLFHPLSICALRGSWPPHRLQVNAPPTSAASAGVDHTSQW